MGTRGRKSRSSRRRGNPYAPGTKLNQRDWGEEGTQLGSPEAEAAKRAAARDRLEQVRAREQIGPLNRELAAARRRLGKNPDNVSFGEEMARIEARLARAQERAQGGSKEK